MQASAVMPISAKSGQYLERNRKFDLMLRPLSADNISSGIFAFIRIVSIIISLYFVQYKRENDILKSRIDNFLSEFDIFCNYGIILLSDRLISVFIILFIYKEEN